MENAQNPTERIPTRPKRPFDLRASGKFPSLDDTRAQNLERAYSLAQEERDLRLRTAINKNALESFAKKGPQEKALLESLRSYLGNQPEKGPAPILTAQGAGSSKDFDYLFEEEFPGPPIKRARIEVQRPSQEASQGENKETPQGGLTKSAKRREKQKQKELAKNVSNKPKEEAAGPISQEPQKSQT